MGDTFSPHLDSIGEVFGSPKAGTLFHATPHLLLETPYITNLYGKGEVFSSPKAGTYTTPCYPTHAAGNSIHHQQQYSDG
ncbi:hypothetical protein Pmani_020918 [Petrolisthes manimaculis]|uniref:Uncharacterized protein n=1 Tax=Petrolisthes manimaculis TaxID=1843537 RepID=A0AAE1PF72_9EUCA|nr:hypothetical protein Pmani_020918 [Petrolisthes manimaculis]